MSNLEREPVPERCESGAHRAPALEALPGRTTTLGDVVVRRLLPTRGRRLIGPWCFLDHYGPLTFGEGRPMMVGAHPHMGLQTVSWLLEGEVLHRDSLGSEQLVRPGELSLMTAGRGISHAEETPIENSGRLHGVQLWIALPDAERTCEPRFEHLARVPALDARAGGVSVFLGSLGSASSPARTPWPCVGAEVRLDAHGEVHVPLQKDHEHAIVVLTGEPSLGAQPLVPDQLHDLGGCREGITLTTGDEPARLLLIGGAPLNEPVLMWWNFVGRTADEFATAREDWETGRRFGHVPADRVPAPPFTARPVHRDR